MDSSKVLIRREGILSFMREHGDISIEEICEAFEISPVTARRDIKALQIENMVWKVNQGYFSAIRPLSSQDNREIDKIRFHITELTVNSLANNSIVFLGPETVNELIADMLLEKKRGLTIIASNINHVSILRNQDRHDVYLTGGKIDPQTGIVYGSYAENVIGAIISDVAIFGCSSINLEKGVIFRSELETQIISKVSMFCKNLFIIADHTQFTDELSGSIFQLKKINAIFTDNEVDANSIKKIRDMGIKVFQTTYQA
ncbi:MAG: DeoR/GlpR transcriptional regulator [Candidatus Methanofastidiosa archaeon]|nr:DeoR/GlpR transcriptional regulator [Candidatus Methanofastidiosa archaeon]